MNARALAPALAAGLAACTSEPDQEQTALSHVHGLGIDPSDGRLYVATHDGLFTPDGKGEPQLVGDSRDDFMGFTVAGSQRLSDSVFKSVPLGAPPACEGASPPPC